MNQKVIIILISILILFVGYNTIITTNIKTDVKKYKNSIDSIQTKIDSVSLINKELDLKLDSLDTNINHITKEIDLVDNNINVIKKKTNEKIVVVDHYDNAELNGFFSGRYGN
jgi:archaellum component FlaC